MTSAATRIRHLVVVIPARDEEQRLERAVTSVIAAIDRLPRSVGTCIVVACDSCRDSTPRIAAILADAHPQLLVVEGRWGSAGAARRAAVAAGLDAITPGVRFGDAAGSTTWIATTDADTVVPDDWLIRQLAHAESGAHGVAGIVELLRDDDRTAEVESVFDELYRYADPTAHPHVHGANMGVRADAYVLAGGFPDVTVAEDHALWGSLSALGLCCVSAIDVRVATSARLRGRAAAGFAALLTASLGDVAARTAN